jgi:hypothetical protein
MSRNPAPVSRERTRKVPSATAIRASMIIVGGLVVSLHCLMPFIRRAFQLLDSVTKLGDQLFAALTQFS